MGIRYAVANLSVALLLTCAAAAHVSPIEPGAVYVIDGDTIDVAGTGRVRLVGFNTPETRRAECPAERERGNAATRRLRQIVAAGGLTLRLEPCACSPGTQGTPRCNYGRACGRLLSRGEDVGAILIRERLAVAYACGPTRCPRRERPWCD